MDRGLPRSATGFHPYERDGETTFVWTADRAVLSFAGLDRSTSWICAIRFRGARPPDLAQPTLQLVVDGVAVAAREATNDYQDAEVTLARRARAGATLQLISARVFVPGGDPRRLGVQIDRLE
jgi:hypothetical protein